MSINTYRNSERPTLSCSLPTQIHLLGSEGPPLLCGELPVFIYIDVGARCRKPRGEDGNQSTKPTHVQTQHSGDALHLLWTWHLRAHKSQSFTYAHQPDFYCTCSFLFLLFCMFSFSPKQRNDFVSLLGICGSWKK